MFSSANALRRYTMEELVALGVSWVWLGLEGEGSEYAKLDGTDTRALVAELQSHGIRVLGSSIIGLPEHTPRHDRRRDRVRGGARDGFHQFMLYTPVPGTALYEEHRAKGTLLSEEECSTADAHGQLRFNFRHPHIQHGEETDYLLRAFQRDFDRNGPSITRVAQWLLVNWQRYGHDPDPRVRRRIRRESAPLPTVYAGLLWAAERWLADNPAVTRRLRATRMGIVREFGLRARIAGPIVGRYALSAMRREAARLARGWTYEPPTFYEHNIAARALAR